MNAPWPADTWERMVRAVEAVEGRLTRSTVALKAAGVPHAVIGAHAVAYWVAQADDGAVRNTPNVDLLIRPEDYDVAKLTIGDVGFISVGRIGPH